MPDLSRKDSPALGQVEQPLSRHENRTMRFTRYIQELLFCFKVGASLSDKLRLAHATLKFHFANGLFRVFPQSVSSDAPHRYRVCVNGHSIDLWLRTYTGDVFIFYEVMMDCTYRIPFELGRRIETIVDLGAHIGLTTLFYSQVYTSANFVCVEPDPGNLAVLRQNIAGIQDRVQIIAGAVSGKPGYGIFTDSSWSWGGHLSHDERSGRQVRCYSMDEIVELSAFQTIDLLKVDVEGEEKQLLAKPSGWLGRVRLAIIELHDSFSIRDIESNLSGDGYRVVLPDSSYDNRLTLLLGLPWQAERPAIVDQQPLTCIFIACSGHSGSTLLETLLANHPDVFGLGEFNHFANYYDDPQQRCGCGKVIAECEFWDHVVHRALAGQSGPLSEMLPTDRLRPKALPSAYGAILLLFPRLFWLWSRWPQSLAQRNLEILCNYWDLISLAAEESGCRTVIDKSMSPSHVLELFYSKPNRVRLKVIFLVRDGRANMFSYMRNLGVSAEYAAKNWKGMNRHLRWISRRLPAGDLYQLRYEDLCQDPAGTLKVVSDFVGVTYSDSMLTLHSKVQHGIAGNAMRFRNDTEIVLDDRWKSQLSSNDLVVFEQIAGNLNRSFGYH